MAYTLSYNDDKIIVILQLYLLLEVMSIVLDKKMNNPYSKPENLSILIWILKDIYRFLIFCSIVEVRVPPPRGQKIKLKILKNFQPPIKKCNVSTFIVWLQEKLCQPHMFYCIVTSFIDNLTSFSTMLQLFWKLPY